MYKVIKGFTDIQDDGHKYNVGDTFPRDGLKVSKARLDKLAGTTNRQRTPLIEEVKVTAKVADTTPAPLEKVEQGDAPAIEESNPKRKNQNRKKY